MTTKYKINGYDWELEFACETIYYCSELDRYAEIIDGEIVNVGSFDDVTCSAVAQ
jgi:hypothetical protein